MSRLQGMSRPEYDLFTPVAKLPTGPQTDVARFAPPANTYRAYVLWKQTDEGRRFLGYLERAVLTAAAAGEQRISVNALHELTRRNLKVEANNSYRPWIADDLVSRHPHLEKLIERRKRRKAKDAA